MPKKTTMKVEDTAQTAAKASLLLKVEDLINMAMGPPGQNIVNFKLMQTILFILARQMRVLGQQVELRGADESFSSSEDSVQDKEESSKSKEEREKERAEKHAAKDREKGEKSAQKEREKQEKDERKEKEREERRKSKSAGHKDEDAKSEAGDVETKDKTEKAKSKDKKDKRDKSAEKGEPDKVEKEGKSGGKDADRGADKEEKKEKSSGKDKDLEQKDKSGKDTERKEKSGKDTEKGETDKEEREKDKKIKEGKEGGKKEKSEEKKGDSGFEEDNAKSVKSVGGDKSKDKGDKSKDGEEKEKGGAEMGKKGGEKVKEGSKGKREADIEEDTRSVAGKKGDEEKDATGGGKRNKKGKEVIRKSSGLSVTEREGPGKDKIIVVEKGSTREPHKPHVADIEVVTQEQFEALERAVQVLKQKAGPLPPPTMPDNQKLRHDIVKGSASLTDTMQAMQLTARVEAAEKAITNMAELLTQLASTGALPKDLASKAQELRADVDQIKGEINRGKGEGKDKDTVSISSKKSVKSVALHPTASGADGKKPFGGAGSYTSTGPGGGGITMGTSVTSGGVGGGISTMGSGAGTMGPGPRASVAGAPSNVGRPSVSGRMSVPATMPPGAVTHGELQDAIEELRTYVNKNLTSMVNKAGAVADQASAQARALSDKMDIANKLNTRVNALYALVGDYSEQLSGFDAGLTTQMQGFQEQMVQMRGDLSAGLALLDSVNNTADTAVMIDLQERYGELVREFDTTLHRHSAMEIYQRQLTDEFKILVEWVEMMREQKVDRDEVMDGLRDKADISRLATLLSQEEFDITREELQMRLNLCDNKFKKQDAAWMAAIEDLTSLVDYKADISELVAARERAEAQIKELNQMVHKVTVLLGDPKAAFVCRKLSKDATCGICKVPALMEPTDPRGPPRLPQAWQGPQPADINTLDDVECQQLVTAERADDKAHYCKRYCGGSHTLLSESCVRQLAPPAHKEPPARRYIGPGTDNKMYLLEEEYMPCEECNVKMEDEKIPGEADLPADGAGDAVTHHVTYIDTSSVPGTQVIVNAVEDLVSQDDAAKPNLMGDGASKSHGLNKDGHRSSQDRSGAHRASQDGGHRLSQQGELHRTVTESKRNLPGTVNDMVRHEDIGIIVKGHVTLMDEDEVVREEIMHEMKVLEDQGVPEHWRGGDAPE